MNADAAPSARAETPSGKSAATENFPVGSWLLPQRARPHILHFYRYARAIDDIADNPALPADDKIVRLEAFARAIRGEAVDEVAYETGVLMRESLLATDVPLQHCLDLIDAFKQDAVKSRYRDWDDLMDYCMRSAAPVGRYLIDITGGSNNGYAPSDSLCCALQVINHLQDCKNDYVDMDRVYLPGDWMTVEGADVTMLAGTRASPQLRAVIDRCLDASHALMRDAHTLSGGVNSRHLAMESAAIVNIADKLIVKLRREDPIAGRVKLSKVAYAACFLRGAVTGLFG